MDPLAIMGGGGGGKHSWPFLAAPGQGFCNPHPPVLARRLP